MSASHLYACLASATARRSRVSKKSRKVVHLSMQNDRGKNASYLSAHLVSMPPSRSRVAKAEHMCAVHER